MILINTKNKMENDLTFLIIKILSLGQQCKYLNIVFQSLNPCSCSEWVKFGNAGKSGQGDQKWYLQRHKNKLNIEEINNVNEKQYEFH